MSEYEQLIGVRSPKTELPPTSLGFVISPVENYEGIEKSFRLSFPIGERAEAAYGILEYLKSFKLPKGNLWIETKLVDSSGAMAITDFIKFNKGKYLGNDLFFLPVRYDESERKLSHKNVNYLSLFLNTIEIKKKAVQTFENKSFTIDTCPFSRRLFGYSKYVVIGEKSVTSMEEFDKLTTSEQDWVTKKILRNKLVDLLSIDDRSLEILEEHYI